MDRYIGLRRVLMQLIILVAPAFILLACQSVANNQEKVIDSQEVNEYNGELVISLSDRMTEEWMRTYVEPVYSQIYPKVTIVYDVEEGRARYDKLLAQKENPEADLFISTNEMLFEAIKDGLLNPLNPDNIPNIKNLYDWATPYPEYGVAYTTAVLGIGYNPFFFRYYPPTSWEDLWRADVQGRIAVPAIGHDLMPEFILQAAELFGGSAENIEPGFENLAKLNPDIQALSYGDWKNRFDSDDIIMVVDLDCNINNLAASGVNIKYVLPLEGGWGSAKNMAVVTGTENQESVEAFINLMLSTEIQQSLINNLSCTPARKDIKVQNEQARYLAAYGNNLHSVKWFDEELYVSVRQLWTEDMNQFVAPIWGETSK